MTIDISNKLIQIANYFSIGMKIYKATANGKILIYILDEVNIRIIRSDLAVIHFSCTSEYTGAFEELSYIDFEEGKLFIDFDEAQEQAAMNLVKYYKEGN